MCLVERVDSFISSSPFLSPGIAFSSNRNKHGMGCQLKYLKAIVVVGLSFIDDNTALGFVGIPSVDAFNFKGSRQMGIEGGLGDDVDHASDISITVAN